MQKIIRLCSSAIAVIALSACGGTSSTSNAEEDNIIEVEDILPQSYAFVDVLDLDDGYIAKGQNFSGEEVSLGFCLGSYTYNSADESWYGSYSLNGQRINMFDETDTGGSYRIDTFNSLLEVGEAYTIDFQNDEIIIEEIIDNIACRSR